MVAAEPSSTHYAEKILDAWKLQGIEVEAFGIGSQAMAKKGFDCIGHSEELAVMGIQEVIGAFKKIYHVFYALLKAAEDRKPDVVLLLDYPDFNLRLAKKMKKKGFRVVYYISPSIWAWRTSRVNIVRKFIDKMFVLFPFEVDFYKKYGVDAEFVGHPLLDDLRPELSDKKFGIELRQRYGVLPTDKVLGLMPGSRNFELEHHLPVQLDAAEKTMAQIPNLKVMLFVAPNLTIDKVKSKISNLKIPIIFVQKDPFEMVSMADFVLCASGTATLTVGLMEKPMAIMYIMKKMTVFIGRIIMTPPKHFGLVNIVAEKLISKEFFQENATGSAIAEEAIRVLKTPSVYEEEVGELRKLKKNLSAKEVYSSTANERVAESILRLIP
jgi:lipid-A-disaccharide synthase